MIKKEINTIELPDVAEFLNVSRRFIREIDLLDKSEGLDAYKKITKEAAAKVGVAALNYAEKTEIKEATQI